MNVMRSPEYNSKFEYLYQEHARRYLEHVRSMPHALLCQECGGSGHLVMDRIDCYTIWMPCGWCEGTGLLTAHRRGEWLRYMKGLKG